MVPLLTQAREWYRKGWISKERYAEIIDQIKEKYVKESNGKEYSNGRRVETV
jgi:methionine synthase II (cobalamin-independent)